MIKLEQSPTVAFGDKVRDRHEAQNDLIPLYIGESNKPTHSNIIDKANSALSNGHTKYSSSQGLIELREAIRQKLISFNGFYGVSSDEILITNGAVHGINIALGAILLPGDECIVIEPMWKTYSSIIYSKSAVPVVIVDSNLENDSIDIDLIENAISNKTKAIIINTPNNPSGKVYSESFLGKLLELAQEKNFFIISDEVYERFYYGGLSHFSIGSMEQHPDKVISVYSFSKSYSMTGWRIGYVIANQDILKKILILSQISITNLAPFTQMAALEAISCNEVEESVLSFVEEMDDRFSSLKQYIDEHQLTNFFQIPRAGFYCLINIEKFGNSLTVSNDLLDKFNIALTPGISFGDSMDGFLRLSLAAQDKKVIMKALESVKIFLNFKN
jgi:aspartate aminotransferase